MTGEVLSAHVRTGDPKAIGLVVAALKRNKGSVEATAAELAISVRTLYNWRDAQPALARAFAEHALGREGAAARATRARRR